MDILEPAVKLAGGLLAFVALVDIFLAIRRGMHRSVTSHGMFTSRWLRSTLFYLLASLGFFGLCALIWIPLPFGIFLTGRILTIIIGALLLFPGLALVLWGRLALGRFYYVSSSLDAPLYTDHQLITTGPYAFTRHPMYLGMFLATLGGLLIYRTWTLVFLFVCTLGLLLRARREEQALAERFGGTWQDYTHRVPLYFPRLWR